MLYEFNCETHGDFEIICPVAEHKNPYDCPTCGGPSYQRLSANVFMQPDAMWHGKYIAALGREFTSKKQLSEFCERNGCIKIEPGMDKDVENNKKYIEQKEDIARHKTLAQEIQKF